MIGNLSFSLSNNKIITLNKNDMKTKKPTVLQANQGESVSVVGDRYTFLTTKEQTEGTFAQMEFYIPPGGGSPPHTHHNEDEFLYMVEGEL